MMATGMYSFPQFLMITGRQTSTDVTPATHIGASFPNHFANTGVNSRQEISLIMFVRSATVASSAASCSPNVAEAYSAISTDDSE